MRNLREILKSLSNAPRGFNADGRTLGLGLAVAMEKQRQDNHRKVEEYLRTADGEQRTTAASA
jgi:hypothetical protein